MTKAATLASLYNTLSSAEVLPLNSFSYQEFLKDSTIAAATVHRREWGSLIVRSSKHGEDSVDASHAGEYETIIDVDGGDPTAIKRAMETVFSSYGNPSPQDEVLIQPMLKSITMAGVATTCRIDNLSPYYTINYDLSGSGESITNGSAFGSLHYRYREASPLEVQSGDTDGERQIGRVIALCRELETILNNRKLDIEFAFEKDKLYLLQVRPIVVAEKKNLSYVSLHAPLRKIAKKVNKLLQPQPSVLGKRTLFSVMSDWNPAEMIGRRPRMLSLSLYKELITDRIWSQQRYRYGYRDLRSHPLLISFFGQPFIDVRASFNSFVPRSLKEETAEKLINGYLAKLKEKTHLHDKIEFDIAFSCYIPGFEERVRKEYRDILNEEEIIEVKEALFSLTENIIGRQKLMEREWEKAEKLFQLQEEVIGSRLYTLDKIYRLIEDCKQFGTLPFAGLARSAFIATQILNGLVKENILSTERREAFLHSTETVSRRMAKDFNSLPQSSFLSAYGHLRPNTYDILSLSYRENFASYFRHSIAFTSPTPFSLTEVERRAIDQWLATEGFSFHSDALFHFIKRAIELREESKFIFTRSIDAIFALLIKLGKEFEVSREHLSFLDIQELVRSYAALDGRDMPDILLDNINRSIALYRFTEALSLPPVITNARDVYGFTIDEGAPNYITDRKITAEITDDLNEISGKVALIAAADPGYDYIFGKGIAGLVTQYGGANSHMAVRSAELGIPAAIGVGEKVYQELKKSRVIELDCGIGSLRSIT